MPLEYDKEKIDLRVVFRRDVLTEHDGTKEVAYERIFKGALVTHDNGEIRIVVGKRTTIIAAASLAIFEFNPTLNRV